MKTKFSNNKEKMKSILIYGQAIILASIIFVKCQSVFTKDNLKNTICTNCQDEEMNTLEVKLIHKMVDVYRNNQLKAINEASSTGRINNFGSLPNDVYSNIDSHSIWFDLEKLKKFICQIESNSKNIDSNDLGIRIYYAAYPTINDNYSDLNDFNQYDEHKGRHTLVCVPTVKIKNSNEDFNPLDEDTYKGNMKDALKYSKDSNYKTMCMSFARIQNTNPRTSALNHGNLIPPAENETEAF